MIEGTEGKSAREFFVALISVGPSKLPISYVLESFDLTMKAYNLLAVPSSPEPVVELSTEKADDGTPISKAAIEAWEAQKKVIEADREAKKAAGIQPHVAKDDWRVEEDES